MIDLALGVLFPIAAGAILTATVGACLRCQRHPF